MLLIMPLLTQGKIYCQLPFDLFEMILTFSSSLSLLSVCFYAPSYHSCHNGAPEGVLNPPPPIPNGRGSWCIAFVVDPRISLASESSLSEIQNTGISYLLMKVVIRFW